GAAPPPFSLRSGEPAHVCVQHLVLVGDGVEEQALDQVAPAVLLGHLVHQALDLPPHVLVGPAELEPEGDLLVEALQDSQELAVEDQLVAGGEAGPVHRPASFLPAKAWRASASSRKRSMILCTPVMEIMVSTRG